MKEPDFPGRVHSIQVVAAWPSSKLFGQGIKPDGSSTHANNDLLFGVESDLDRSSARIAGAAVAWHPFSSSGGGNGVTVFLHFTGFLVEPPEVVGVVVRIP